ncbi:MAG: endonuclease/exonuclease/phosphatase family protein [Gemmatimonadetes bacterium]|nr:endonuclease/exonuclease/phosphatase family protein [Gemmatimonadota bacterium]
MLVAQWVTVGLGVLAALLTALSLFPGSHWMVRLWDFPRLQIAALASLSGAVYAAAFFRGGALEWAFLATAAATALWQARKIFPYTPLARTQVQRSTVGSAKGRSLETRRHPSFRLLITNVQMENTEHERLLRVIEEAAPDVVLAVETDAVWARALGPLAPSYPHVVRQPQENWYGMMLFSRLPLLEARCEFLVQDDIPSVHAVLELPGGVHVFLHGIHPRPPEPIRDQDSTPRDAELVVVGNAIGDAADRPTVVAGDLNDVAWSPTSELFIRLSGLLDPRRGRGFYNSYNAKNPVFRYPLDHVFHSNHFRLVELRRLPRIGSDHYPMLIELSYEPDAEAAQPEPEEEAGDGERAEDRLEAQAEAAATGDDRPGRE